MASIFTPSTPITGPWVIDREDCIGDSLGFINANTNFLGVRVNTLSANLNTQINNLSAYATGTGLLSSNGYYRLPGGLIIQWGETGTFTSQATLSVNFPTTFATQCFNVQTTWKLNAAGSGSAEDTWVQTVTYDRTAAQFQIQNSSATTPSIGRITWLAVGY